MAQYLLLLVVALTVGGIVFGVTVLVSGSGTGLAVAEPDGRAVPLPGTRPLMEDDVASVRFDTALRGYRMAQVDQALRRAAYDIGYKDELIGVLEAEVAALREGRSSDADVLRRAREAAIGPPAETVVGAPTLPGAASTVPIGNSTVPAKSGALPAGYIGVHVDERPADEATAATEDQEREPIAVEESPPEPDAQPKAQDAQPEEPVAEAGEPDPAEPVAEPAEPVAEPEAKAESDDGAEQSGEPERSGRE
jgi:DivIVA domain-containing protein